MFINSQFPTSISYTSAGGPTFNTVVNAARSGMETRQINWQSARHKYTVAYGDRNQADFDAILNLFNAAQGKATSFRFKDWSDYKSCGYAGTPSAADQIIGTGDGSTTVFQLVKAYTVAGVTNTRKIRAPVANSVLIAFNGVTQNSGWTVDTTTPTGLVTFSAPPGAGVVITAGFQFDVPCRYDVDELSIVLSKPQICNTQITLIEDMNV